MSESLGAVSVRFERRDDGVVMAHVDVDSVVEWSHDHVVSIAVPVLIEFLESRGVLASGGNRAARRAASRGN